VPEPSQPDRARKVEAIRALARASRILERAAAGELSLAHYRVLSAVAGGEQRASRLATRLALGKPTVSAAVDALCQRGLLARSSAVGDQRVAVLTLTEAGDELLAQVETAMLDRVAELFDHTAGGEHLIDSLVWLGGAIDDVMTQRLARGKANPR
jgi:DNA-binding MarR family transcriptional regulator